MRDARLQLILELVTDGIIIADYNGVITEVNQPTLQIYGFDSKNEMLGKNAFQFIAPYDRERAILNIHQAAEAGVVRCASYTLLRTDGSEFPGELRASGLKDAAGIAVGLVTITKNGEAPSSKQQQILVADSPFRIDELTSSIAHELNNPLTSVIGFSDMLLEQEVPGDIKENLRIINKEAKRAAETLRNLVKSPETILQKNRRK